MLIQSSFPCSIEAAPFYISDHGKEDVLCDRMPSAETWQVYLKCKDHPFDRCRKAEPMQDDSRNADDPCSSNFPSSLGWPSTVSTMTENTIPNKVYRRKKLRKDSTAPLLKLEPVNVQRCINFTSIIGSCAHLSSAEDQPAGSEIKHEIGTVKDPVAPAALYDRAPYFSNQDSKNQCLLGEDGDGATKNSLKKNLGIDSVNDSCSTSKSNVDLASDSIETERNETGECSSSSVIAMDVMREDQSEKDFCINILRSYGLLGGAFPTDNGASEGDAVTAGKSCCRRSCKICSQFAGSLKMLICDHCEEAYHPACWNPRWKKKLPLDEWFCNSCLIKKRKILSETITRSSPGINSELGGTILSTLKDTEPYTTKVRIGKGFQAEVPEWLGPISSDYDVAEPSEIDCSEISFLKDENFTKPASHSAIGNWLQCREVMDRSNGTICGKWRRAPIFEVQADDWECFCAIHWDPAHADCAAPQEMETDQVLKQLKYIEMLRPRLTKRKSECSKRSE
ncbi:hypothetical protein L6164_002934 [Bauhinia variegata]|uniref:Uncharacterized protein n=1 Tax=Bauhinia variegata TaxID=167791 RepID=A0ACB9Q1P3_BAUVA|nr:hypothetical protein L6164_002934 [Bauhinia variegata]